MVFPGKLTFQAMLVHRVFFAFVFGLICTFWTKAVDN